MGNSISFLQEKRRNLPNIKYNDLTIQFDSIAAFDISVRRSNDEMNHMREYIIGAIYNSKIPTEYYIFSSRWKRLKETTDKYLGKLLPDETITDVKCVHKGGRNSKYDFEIILNKKHVFKIEFKFNSSSQDSIPQFVSPMKPSQYLSDSYESHYYNHYLIPISKKFNMEIPSEEEYLQKIHSPDPKCMKEFQEKYYKGCKNSSRYKGNKDDISFYNELIKKSKESIQKFIEQSELDIEKLNEYLKKTQDKKIYMMYKNDEFYFEESIQYQIESYTKTKTSYMAKTTTNKKICILLRWKNGNGIAFPAFQISLQKEKKCLDLKKTQI